MGSPAGLAPTAEAVRAARRGRAIALAVWAVPMALILTSLYWRLAVGALPLGLGVLNWVLPAAIAAVMAALLWALIVEPNSRGNALGDELRASARIDAEAVARDDGLVAQGKQVEEHAELCAETVEAELLEANECITDALEVSHRALQIASGVLGVGTVPAVRSENLVKPTMPHIDRVQGRARAELARQRELAAQLGVRHLPELEALPSPHVALTNPADVPPGTDHVDPRGLPAFAGSTLAGTPAEPIGKVPERRPRRMRLLLVLLAVVLVAALVWVLLAHRSSPVAAAPAPSPSADAGVPAQPTVPSGLAEGVDYSFLGHGPDGQAPRWGCGAPITVRLVGPAPAGGEDAVDTFAPLTDELMNSLGCVGNRPPRAVSERHMYRVLPYLRHGPVTDLVLSEAQWLAEEVISDVVTATTIAGVRLWLLVEHPVSPGLLTGLVERYGQLHPWDGVLAYWADRLAGASTRAASCPAVAQDWPLAWRGWPAGRGCPLHAARVQCLLAFTRRELTAARTDPGTVRELVMAVEADTATSPDEVWALRDAGRDLYTPALDAVSRLLPPDHRLVDLHAGMVAGDGSWLRTADGERVVVPAPMRKALARQRTASTMCNGPGDWPLLTVFGEVPVRRS